MSAATAGLPAYSGPDGSCPRCGVPGAMTEWHWAGPLAPRDMAGRRPPCAGRGELAVLGGEGEHLCRVCLNCGYGWPEACAGRGAVPRRVPLPPWPGGVLLVSLASGVASTGAASLLGLLLGGTALIIAWLAVTAALAVIAGIGYAVLTGRRGDDVTEGRLERSTAGERYQRDRMD